MVCGGSCAQVAQNEAFRGVVKLAKAARASGQPLYPQQAVEEESSRHLEIRQAAQILNEDELRKALGTKRLPTHMKSIPTLTIQRERDKGGATLEGAAEVVYCFLDPAHPYRTATLVTRRGFACKTDHMNKHLWAEQGNEMLSSFLQRQAESTGEGVLRVSEAVKLQSLEGFVKEKTKKMVAPSQPPIAADTSARPRVLRGRPSRAKAPRSKDSATSSTSSEGGTSDGDDEPVVRKAMADVDASMASECTSQCSGGSECPGAKNTARSTPPKRAASEVLGAPPLVDGPPSLSRGSNASFNNACEGPRPTTHADCTRDSRARVFVVPATSTRRILRGRAEEADAPVNERVGGRAQRWVGPHNRGRYEDIAFLDAEPRDHG